MHHPKLANAKFFTHFAFLLVMVAMAINGLGAVAQTSRSAEAQPQPSSKGLDAFELDQLRYVSQVVSSSEHDHAIFIRVEPRKPSEAPGGVHVRAYRVPAGPQDELTPILSAKRNVGGFSYRPGHNALTFLDQRNGDSHREVYSLPLSGGEAQRLTKTKHGVGRFHWRPDGMAMAFSKTDPLPPARAKAQKAGFRPKVFDEDYRHLSLWIWDASTGESRQLTQGVSVFDLAFSPDGKKLACAVAPRNLVDDSYMAKRLKIIDLPSGGMRDFVDNPGKLGALAWSPDGKSLAYISAADKRDPHAGMLYIMDEGASEARALSADYRGMYHTVKWENSKNLLACVSEGVESIAVRVDAKSGKRTPLFVGKGRAFHGFSEKTKSGQVFAAASTPHHPAEVFELSFGSGRAKRLTNSNPTLDNEELGRQVVRKFKARDGLEIEGLLIYPIDYDAAKLYPLVIVAHGGPESHYSNGWNTHYSTWGQVLAARGYLVWMPNYRASTGYGVAFAKADHGDPMGGEFNDHLDAIALFADEKLIDRKRVGIGGGSYGGYTAAWAATRHSEHFAAAVSFVPFVDIRTKWLTTDIPIEFFLVHYQEKWPHEQEAFLADRSPLTYAPRCKTPLLLLGGTADPRVHPSQPHMLYRAVKTATDTPVRYIQYAGEGHGNRKNVNRYDYCVRTLRWFDHYLKDANSRAKDLPPVDVDYGPWLK
ncbi:MAG: alpha/beta fold hydrolase [Planctomycetota bacterium]